jgi:quinol monooxygenase YgiN
LRLTPTTLEMPVTTIVILDIPATPATRDKVLATLEDALVETRAFDGCAGIELLVNQDQPSNFVVYERWASRAHYERYLEFRQASGFSASFRAMFPDPPVVRKFDIRKNYD